MSWLRTLRAFLVIALVLAWVGAADAAIQEFDLRQGIANCVAVLRYLNREREDAKDKLKMVDYSLKETRAQLEAQKALVEREMASNEPKHVKDVRLAHMTKTLKTLEYHLRKLAEVDFEKIYNARIAMLTREMEYNQILLEAKILEYRVHFGVEPPVSLEYAARESRFRPKTERPGVLVVR